MVSAGARYQRFRPAARGRALRYARKTSYIRVKVDGEQRPIKKKAAVTAKETKK
jgi:ribosomal protein L22